MTVGAPGARELPVPNSKGFLTVGVSTVSLANAPAWAMIMDRVTKKALIWSNLKEDNQTNSIITGNICGANVLPMPVCVSPFAVALGGPGQSAPKYVPAFFTLRELRYLAIFVNEAGCYSAEAEPELYMAARKLHDVLEEDLGKSSITLKAMLEDSVFKPRRAGDINDTNAAYRFVRILEQHTLWTINRIEAYIYDALCLPVDPSKVPIPLCAVLTDHTSVRGSQMADLSADRAHLTRQLATTDYFFRMRSQCWNLVMTRELLKQGKTHHNRVVFNTEDYLTRMYTAIADAIKTPGASRIYKEWLLFDTALEYAKLLDMEYVKESELGSGR